APQRFGNEPFFTYDWGDSEIRYAWKTLTIGFGTQAIWLGPAKINPIIHSNNAPSYSKLDIGLRKQQITLPRLNWYLGNIETRLWWGYLSESDYFDNNSGNDHNLITGFTIAYSPPYFFKGLTLAANRVMLTKWDAFDFQSTVNLFVPFSKLDAGTDDRDQRASLTISYLLPQVGFEVYFEWGINDFSSIKHFFRNSFSTENFTLGTRKNFVFNADIQGELMLEFTNIECARDYEFIWPATFYAHHKISQGHTNRGQWLGAGLGTGGNSQYLGFTLYYPKGYSRLFVQREAPNRDYIWFLNRTMPSPSRTEDNAKFKALISVGTDNYLRLYDHFGFFCSFLYSYIINPTYDPDAVPDTHNIHISLGPQFLF
ncbi:MAG: capsule assembly Wzi family protein, partial [Bacteroidales bacterium]|nr:capsule assembly Wzi family protein [Bacteroidales bacterium]